jgi:hypothetical protein
VAEMLELERQHLMPMPAPFDGYVQEFSRVSSTCLVTVARNRYSVPCEWRGRPSARGCTRAAVVIVADERMVAEHERLSGQGQDGVRLAALRAAGQSASLAHCATARRSRTARAAGQAARGAAAARRRRPADGAGAGPGATAGLDAVLVAAELALERAGPSGTRQPRARGQRAGTADAPPRPENVATALQVR